MHGKFCKCDECGEARSLCRPFPWKEALKVLFVLCVLVWVAVSVALYDEGRSSKRATILEKMQQHGIPTASTIDDGMLEALNKLEQCERKAR